MNLKYSQNLIYSSILIHYIYQVPKIRVKFLESTPFNRIDRGHFISQQILSNYFLTRNKGASLMDSLFIQHIKAIQLRIPETEALKHRLINFIDFI